MNWIHVEDRLRDQRQVVSARQAESAVQSRHLRRVAAGRRWYRPFRGVCGPRLPFDLKREQQAGLLWVGGEVAITGWAALWILGVIDRVPPRTHLLVTHSRRNRYLRRMHVIRSRHIELSGIHRVDRLAVVSAAWAVTDLAARASKNLLRSALIDGRQRGHFALEEILDLLEQRGPIPGRRRLREVIAELAGERSDSTLEHLVRRRLAEDPRLPDPDPGQVALLASDGVRNEIDIGWLSRQVGLECLGFGAHSNRRQLHIDAVRQNALAPTGWIIFSVTWTHLEDDAAWEVLVSQLRAHLRP